MNAQEILRRKLPLGEFGHPIWTESNVIAAMEEYAQQSQSNPSKLVEALEKIATCKRKVGYEFLSDYFVEIAQQALESYKDGCTLDNQNRCSIGLHFPVIGGTCILCGKTYPSPPQTKTI